MKATIPCLLAVILFGLPVFAAAPAADADGLRISPLGDLRVRQEVLDGVYHFSPSPHRNWIRVRSRAGVSIDAPEHSIQLRLNNEHRHHLIGESDFHWDEVILDRAQWSYLPDRHTELTIGRQDIIWADGFLVLESRPLDGSRSMSHDGIRFRTDAGAEKFDIFAVYNTKRDRLVLIDDQDRPLRDMDETAAAFRLQHYNHHWTVIWKREQDPDHILPNLTTLTVDGRFEWQPTADTRLLVELAVQYQDGVPLFDDPDSSYTDVADGMGFAAQAFVIAELSEKVEFEAGGFYYSGSGAGGQNGKILPFRAPWGRWPKWSELYIYTMIGESPPGRTTVAAWENIAAPRIKLTAQLNEKLRGSFAANYLLAPEPGLEVRGSLLQAKLTGQLNDHLSGHLLWETLIPGGFHDGRHLLPPLTDTVHFLRWQMDLAF